MARKENHPVRNGIIATVVGGIILSIVPPLRNFVLTILKHIWAGFVWLWNALTSTYPVPGWLIIIFGIFTIVGLFKIYFAIRPDERPKHMNYTEDFICGTKWRWNWAANRISNLWCYCPNCNNELVYDDSSCRNSFNNPETKLICERCNRRVITSIPVVM